MEDKEWASVRNKHGVNVVSKRLHVHIDLLNLERTDKYSKWLDIV